MDQGLLEGSTDPVNTNYVGVRPGWRTPTNLKASMMSTGNYPFPKRGSLRATVTTAGAILVLFAFVPAVGVFFLSFFKSRNIKRPPKFVGLQNYRNYFGPAHLSDNMNALKNTLIFATLSTVLIIVLGLLIALLLNQKLKGQNFYRSIVFMPTILGVTVTALIWTLMLNPKGPIQQIVKLFGTESSFFGDPKIALYLVIFVSVWAGLGVTVVIFLAGLQAIPEDLYESAAIDGASPWQLFRFVTIPMLAPSITTNVLLGIVNALQSYQLNFVLTGQSNRATQVLSLQVFEETYGPSVGTRPTNIGMASTVSIIQFVLVAIITLITFAILRRREEQL